MIDDAKVNIGTYLSLDPLPEDVQESLLELDLDF